MIETVHTDKAAQPIAPYSRAIKAGGFVFVSGAAAIDPQTGRIPEGDFEEQTELTLQNLNAILEAAGSSLNKVVKVSVFLKSMDDYDAMNRGYEKWWTGHFPARTTISPAGLPRPNLLVEMDAIALV
jgi:2-iminobutanoate/2-iminopropanoate deaminase